MNTVFLDIETTGLDPLKHEILEVAALIDYDGDDKNSGIIHFSLPIDLAKADERAMEINGFIERRVALADIRIERGRAKSTLYNVLKGALVVGNNVQFDLRFIEQLLGMAPWYYSPLDLKAWVAGRCGMPKPASTKLIAEVAGVPLPSDAHTALADARWNKAVYGALVAGR